MKIANVIIALDMKENKEAKDFVSKFSNPTWFKVGMELIYNQGFEIIKFLKDNNHKVFLDLKLYDIPNTVKKSLESLSQYQVDMTTVHTLGGLEMLKQANSVSDSLNILGVTILTSIDQQTLNNEMKISHQVKDQVQHLASLAQEAKLFGIVCSPQEAPLVKNLGLTLVTPGVRREQDACNDQKRITTPAQAKANGSDYIVVGRPITQSVDPVATYNDFVKEFTNG